MNFQNIRTAFHCEMQILTPVHIGNGEKYINNFDFLCEANRARVFDHKRLFAMVEQLGGSHIESFAAAMEDVQLTHWLRSNNININEAVVHSFSFPAHNEPRDINRHIRDGFGRPIIPGSSLKGVFRTAILARLADDDRTNPVNQALGVMKQGKVNVKFADSALCTKLLGKDAKTNLMRALTVADFTFAPEDVQVQNAYVTRLTNSTRFVRKTWNIWIEKLNQSATATGQVSFDDFLIAQAKGKEAFNFKADLTLAWLLEALRKRTNKTLDSELNFLRNKTGDGIDDMKRFYTRLKQDHQNLPENEAIVQFAWGSGWKGMTGELLAQEAVTREVRGKLRLAPQPQYQNYPFPKSRRVAAIGDAALPMGWIRLRFTSKEEMRRADAIKVQEEKRAQQIKIEQEQQQKNEREIWEKMNEVEQCIAIIRGDIIARSQAPGQDPDANCWKKIEAASPEEQKSLAQAFKELWITDPQKWSKKECSKKQWKKVQQIKAILGET